MVGQAYLLMEGKQQLENSMVCELPTIYSVLALYTKM